jgi:CRP-like cAMP-binding protein
MQTDLYTFLKQFHTISEQDHELLMSGLVSKSFKKGEVLVRPGEVQKELYFVRSGIQMSHFESDARNNVIAFTYAPGVCAIPESFSFQVASSCYLTCLSDSELIALPFPGLHELFNQSHNIERLIRCMTEAILAGAIKRHIELHAFSMEERFRIF